MPPRTPLVFMRALVLSAILLSTPAMPAEYQPPKGAPELFIPGHNVTISVFAAQTPIGHGIGIFERRGGAWFLCGQCLISPETPTMENAVKAAGGPKAYVAAQLAAINAVLAKRYPPNGATRAGGTLNDVNEALIEGHVLQMVDGIPQLGSR